MQVAGEALPIRIYYMDSWGELGNRLAAGVLSQALKEAWPGCLVEAKPIESVLPLFGRIGEEIKELTLQCETPLQRSEQYLSLFDRLSTSHFPASMDDTEVPNHMHAEVEALRTEIRDGPRIVIGTKGVISRILGVACRGVTNSPSVVNHVTNRGLLSLEVHRTRLPLIHMVPFEADRDLMVSQYGYDRDRIFAIGPLTAGARLAAELTDEKASSVPIPRQPARIRHSPLVLVFANRDGRQYLEPLRSVASAMPEVAVIFVGLNDEDAVARVRDIAHQNGAHAWRQYLKLPQHEFLQTVHEVASSDCGFMVCKPGPNTVLEAVSLGIPCVVLDSGLPMEQWVCQLVEENKIGAVCRTSNSLSDTICQLASQPERVRIFKENVARLRGKLFDPSNTKRALKAAIELALNDANLIQPWFSRM